MLKFVVTVTRIPTNYNAPVSYVVEAATEDDARIIVKDAIRDLGPYQTHTYIVRPYIAPPVGRILGTI